MKKLCLCLLYVVVGLPSQSILAEPPSEPAFESVQRSDYYDMLRRSDLALRDKQNTNVLASQQRLACAGSQANQAALGGLYLTGRGVSKDDITGYAWLKLAATSGVPKYRELAEILEQSMTTAQRTSADAKVAGLKSLYAPIPTHMNCSQVEAGGSHLKELRCEPESVTTHSSLVWLKRCVSTP